MSQKFIVKVAVEHIVYRLDKLYDYILPKELAGGVALGCRVLVPFGVGNKKRQGIVLQTEAMPNEADVAEIKLKEVFAVLDKAPLLSAEMLVLAQFMKQKYFCTIFDAAKLMIPTGMSFKLHEKFKLCERFGEAQVSDCTALEGDLVSCLKNTSGWVTKEALLARFGADVLNCLKSLEKMGVIQKKEVKKRALADATVKMVRLKAEVLQCDLKLTPKQKMVFDVLKQRFDGISLKEILYLTGVGTAVVDNLVKKTIAEYFEDKIYRDPYKNVNFSSVSRDMTLTGDQAAAYESIYKLYKAREYKVSLLYGITGSGKTSVFMRLIKDVIADGENVIVMVPEIALTAQMVAVFKDKFRDKVAVFHSGLSASERMDEYRRVKDGLVSVVVGTRSAVFAPFERVGLIIMDEEQESSYKSEATPRFHAREIGKFRCCYHKCLLLLSSATPSVESFFFAEQNIYNINILKKRYSGANLPVVSVMDMNKERESGNCSSFSGQLLDRLEATLNDGKQSILLLNRRGYNTLVTCRSCMQVVTCPNCSIALTFHSANQKLMCHCCGFSMDITGECPNCHEHDLKYIGFGTQKAEEELQKSLPDVRILRMDSDTTMTKFAYEKKLNAFANGSYDVMLGTQMIAKGLDFPNVTLVGVLSADQSLYGADFRSYERAFSLLTQVIGRAGRANASGCAVIQTFTPENPIIKLAAEQDYDSFYKDEIVLRRAMLYPPFAKLCVIGFVGEREARVADAAFFFFEILKKLIKSDYSGLAVRILGPSPARIFKANNKFRYKIIVKFKDEKTFERLVNDALFKLDECKKNSGISTFVDVNPESIL